MSKKNIKNTKPKKLGLALGGGGARGCAHIGVIQALEEADIKISYIAGTSIGSVIGGVYANGNLKEFTDFLVARKQIELVKYIDMADFGKGLIKGKKVEKLLNQYLESNDFKGSKIPFRAVATDLHSGKEVIISKGKITDAIRASISIPGVFSATYLDQKYLVDGGVVNPLPVNVVKKMGADIVLAVDLNYSFIQEKYTRRKKKKRSLWSKWFKTDKPSVIESIENSVFILQDQITQMNLEKYPADFLIRPDLAEAKVFDFHRAAEMIEEGYQKTKRLIPKLKKALK